MAAYSSIQSDCLAFLRSLPDDACDLIFTSPPYEEARLYLEGGEDLSIARGTEAWVKWLVEVFGECQRVCKGLVAFVVEGQTEDFRYSCGPALLMADLHRAGFNLRKPPIYKRNGIPGSGSKDWLANCWEWVICTTRPGQLPWSDNTACGHPPKFKPGGAMSNRNAEGQRSNQSDGPKAKCRRGDRTRRTQADRGTKRGPEIRQGYNPPELSNPGNIIDCGAVGGGNIGSKLASENEAPFPEKLVKFFVLSFCPPGGTVCDPFSGSGTTASVSIEHGRNFIGCDLRQSQVDLALRRLGGVTPDMFATEEASRGNP